MASVPHRGTRVVLFGLGGVLFELGGVRSEIAKEALGLAAQKLPIKCKIIGREDVEGAE